MRTRLHPVVWTASALAAFAFWLVWHVGHRGLFLLDHSIVFDGGYRVYLGQVPYRDIYMAYLPGTLWVQALFFWVFGVDYSSMVLPAALLNAVGTLAAMRICWKLFPCGVWPAIGGGLLTALWFQAPFGTLQHEQLGFAFVLLALLAVVESEDAGVRAGLMRLLAGLLLGAAILSKQNAGLLAAPLLLVCIVLQFLPDVRRTAFAVAAFAAGVGVAVAAFLVWVAIYSDWELFWVHALVIPAGFGIKRLIGEPRVLAQALLLLNRPLPSFPLEAFSLLLSLVTLGVSFLASPLEESRRKRLRLASLLTLGLLYYQILFGLTALNNWQNNLPFLGLCFALSAAMTSEVLLGRRLEIAFDAPGTPLRLALSARSLNFVLGGFLLVVGLGLAVVGLIVDVNRTVQEFPSSARFRENLRVPRAAHLVWGEPTMIESMAVNRTDLEGLVGYLAERNRNFFTFPDATILYGLLGRVSPQPMLYFWPNHSFRTVDIPAIDGAMLAALQRNDVRVFIREKKAYVGRQTDLQRFPQTWNWLQLSFRPVREFGLFEVWERP